MVQVERQVQLPPLPEPLVAGPRGHLHCCHRRPAAVSAAAANTNSAAPCQLHRQRELEKHRNSRRGSRKGGRERKGAVESFKWLDLEQLLQRRPHIALALAQAQLRSLLVQVKLRHYQLDVILLDLQQAGRQARGGCSDEPTPDAAPSPSPRLGLVGTQSPRRARSL